MKQDFERPRCEGGSFLELYLCAEGEGKGLTEEGEGASESRKLARVLPFSFFIVNSDQTLLNFKPATETVYKPFLPNCVTVTMFFFASPSHCGFGVTAFLKG